MSILFFNNKNNKNKNQPTKKNTNKLQPRRLNNSYNINESNLEGLHSVNIHSPNWNISPGNTYPERIPLSLQFKPDVPKLKLPAFLQGKGRRTHRRRATKRATKHIKRKN